MALCGRGEINNLSFQNLYRDITVSPSGDKTSPPVVCNPRQQPSEGLGN